MDVNLCSLDDNRFLMDYERMRIFMLVYVHFEISFISIGPIGLI